MKFIIAAALACAATTAAAQENCGRYETIARQLAEKYNEVSVARGLSAGGYVLEVWAAADGSTFTALSIRPDGIACLLDAGSHWSAVTPVRGEPA